jgi:hypothetical protein
MLTVQTWLRATVFVSLAAPIALGACGGGDLRERIATDLARAQNQIAFGMIVPNYLRQDSRRTHSSFLLPVGTESALTA